MLIDVGADFILAASGVKLGWSQLELSAALSSKLELASDQMQLFAVTVHFSSITSIHSGGGHFV